MSKQYKEDIEVVWNLKERAMLINMENIIIEIKLLKIKLRPLMENITKTYATIIPIRTEIRILTIRLTKIMEKLNATRKMKLKTGRALEVAHENEAWNRTWIMYGIEGGVSPTSPNYFLMTPKGLAELEALIEDQDC